MESVNTKVKVYIKSNAARSILDIDSSIFLKDKTEWVEIDEGEGQKYFHAQGNYLPGPVLDEDGIPNFKHVPNETPPYICRTKEEKAAELANRPPEPQGELDNVKAELLATKDALASMYELLLLGGVIGE